MTRLLTTGFETGDLSDIYNTATTFSVVTTSPTPRTGGYCFKITTDTTNFARLKGWTAVDTIYGGFALFFFPSGTPATLLAKLVDASGNVLMTFRTNTSSFINYYMGDSNTLLGTGSNQLPANEWVYLEFYVYIADASGRLTVKMNGMNDIDFTGDTRYTTFGPQIANLWLCGSATGGTGFYNAFDDIVINNASGTYNNTFPGAIKLQPIRPTGAGDVTQLFRGGTDSGANWSQVEEVPASSTDYVYHTVIDNYDLYNMDTFTLPSGAMIKNVIPVAAALMDSGAGNIALMVKSGATTASGLDQGLTTTLRPYTEAWAKNPDDSNDWEQADIDAIQIGEKVR